MGCLFQIFQGHQNFSAQECWRSLLFFPDSFCFLVRSSESPRGWRSEDRMLLKWYNYLQMQSRDNDHRRSEWLVPRTSKSTCFRKFDIYEWRRADTAWWCFFLDCGAHFFKTWCKKGSHNKFCSLRMGVSFCSILNASYFTLLVWFVSQKLQLTFFFMVVTSDTVIENHSFSFFFVYTLVVKRKQSTCFKSVQRSEIFQITKNVLSSPSFSTEKPSISAE